MKILWLLALMPALACADTLTIRTGNSLTVWQGSFVDVDAQHESVNIRFGSYTNSQLITRDPYEQPMDIENTKIIVDGVIYRNCQIVKIKARPLEPVKVKANCD